MLFRSQAILIYLVPEVSWEVQIQSARENFLVSKVINQKPDENDQERNCPHAGELEQVQEDIYGPELRDAELIGTAEEMYSQSLREESAIRFNTIRLNYAEYPDLPLKKLPSNSRDIRLEARYNNGKRWYPCTIVNTEHSVDGDKWIQTVKYDGTQNGDDEDAEELHKKTIKRESWWCWCAH